MQEIMLDRPILFLDMDGTATVWKTVETERLYEKGYYRSLRPHSALVKVIRDDIRAGAQVVILSHYLSDSDYALTEKMEWVDEFIPEIKNRLFVPYGICKAEYVCEYFGIKRLSSNFVLLDDYSTNLFEWQLYGGTGIKFLNNCNGTGLRWKGARITEADLQNRRLIAI